MLMLIGVVVVSFLLALKLPAYYLHARWEAEASVRSYESADRHVAVRPFLSIVLLCGGVLPAWYLTESLSFTLFVLLLAVAAYVDWMTTWVPDLLIFALSWMVLLGGLSTTSGLVPLPGAWAMLVPALMLNGLTALRRQPPALASGDLYLLPAAGAWLPPESALVCFLVSLLLSSVVGRFRKEVPFITILYPVFMVFSLCGDHFSWFLRWPAF